jgi:hypothetical protein
LIGGSLQSTNVPGRHQGVTGFVEAAEVKEATEVTEAAEVTEATEQDAVK